MNEKLLSFIWFNSLCPQQGLVTTEGESVSIIKRGFTNNDSGPDVTDAQIRIGKIVWAGNVEFHVKSSHWRLHNHHNDPAYSNIILHVVFEDDEPLKQPDGGIVPTLVLPFEQKYSDAYNNLLASNDFALCRCGFEALGTLKTSCFYDRLTIERIKHKSAAIIAALETNKGDWNETFWQFLARAFGFGKNTLPFQLLAQSVSFSIIEKNRHSPSNILSILYGQAGFFSLPRFASDQYLNLQREYYYQKQKYGLEAINPAAWKFAGMRPVSFPDRRIQQLMTLVVRNENLFSSITDTQTLDNVVDIFHIDSGAVNCPILPNFSPQQLGSDTINLLIINLVVPFLYAYSTIYKSDDTAQRAISFLESLPPEKNSVTKFFSNNGLVSSSAFDTQAQLQLFNEYCKPKKCIECQVGRYLVMDGITH